MSWLSKIFGGGGNPDSSQVTAQQSSTTFDPLQSQKTAVATPLSQFLASNVGQGIGQYPTDPNYTNRYNEFLSVSPSEYFQKNISDPAIAQYKRDILPLITEGYAGGLRGSGRYGAEETGLNTFAEGLASQEAQFVPQFAQAQLGQGQTEFARQYGNWFNSLSQNNPALASAINFLNSGKQDVSTTGQAFQLPVQGTSFLQDIGQQGLSKQIGNLGNGGSINEMFKSPQFWTSLAALAI